MELILNFVGWFMIWMIVDYKRGEESVIKAFSFDHFIVLIVTFVGVMLATLKLN